MIEWAQESPYLATLVMIVLGYALIYSLLAVITRFYRLIMVLGHGWPPPHLDADGDWKSK